MIHIKNLHKTFFYNSHATRALHNINLNIKKGEIFGIIGRSGSGKTTLLRCIALLDQACSGDIYLEQLCVNKLKNSELRAVRRRIGIVFQHYNLLNSRTVFENIALPLEILGEKPTEIDQKVKQQLALVNLTEQAQLYPAHLSGGQKQRVAIARALITDPAVLLCDEPTSALDPESTRSILDLLKEINQRLKITIVVITHEMSVIKKICDCVAVIDQGRVVEEGLVLDIFTKPRSQITRALTQESLNLKVSPKIQKRLQQKFASELILVVRLAFVGNMADEPVLYAMHTRFNVVVNILQADLEMINEAAVGFMLCLFIGEPANITEAITYLKTLHVEVEVMGYE